MVLFTDFTSTQIELTNNQHSFITWFMQVQLKPALYNVIVNETLGLL